MAILLALQSADALSGQVEKTSRVKYSKMESQRTLYCILKYDFNNIQFPITLNIRTENLTA